MEVNEGASTSKDLESSQNLVEENDILPGCSTFEEFLQTAYPFVMKGVKFSNSLPVDKQFSFYTTFRDFKKQIKEQEVDVQNMIQKLLCYCGSKRSIAAQRSDNKFDLIIDTNDTLLERVSKNLNELDTAGRNPISIFKDSDEPAKNISGSWNKKVITTTNKHVLDESISKKNNIHVPPPKRPKPQTYFKDKVDNKNDIWVPIIKEKPNALKPLSILLTTGENGEMCYTHPYEYELELFKVPKNRLGPISKPTLPKDVQNTECLFIKDEYQIDELIHDLLQQKEIAVDLEHHSYRSFMGITCLLQISTRHKDYIIDTLALRHLLYKLNEVFTKPTILKIFHCAKSDVAWLQRDFGVYVVNMFDTYHAAKLLNYAKLGLSHLLKKFCQVDTDKKYQLFDWRIRPLPKVAVNYARTDTHYLIYIYEKMSNELINVSAGQTNLLSAVYQRSTETCKRIYQKPILTETSYMTLYRQSRRLFDSRQLYALKEIYKWRDTVARQDDESPGYILSNHMMMQICQTLPREIQGILACCNPIPPAVRQHLLKLHNLILKAKEQPLIVTLVEESAKPSSQFSASRDFDIEAKISTYIHDNAGLEFRDDYPTLLGQPALEENEMVDMDLSFNKSVDNSLCSPEPKLHVMVNTIEEFIDLELKDPVRRNNAVEEITTRMEKVKFITPYERYKKVLPYSRKLEEEELEKQRLEEEKINERRLQTQYNILPATSQTSNEENQENNECQEKENILKRRPSDVKVEPLSADNPGKRRRMMQKFDVCEPNEDVDYTDTAFKKDSVPNNPIGTIKKEAAPNNPVGSTNEGTVGVVGGEVSVAKKRRQGSPSRHQRRHEDFTPYDYRKVDFSKFQSDAPPVNRVSLPDSKFNTKVKRNKKFQGRHHYGNRKAGGRKF